MTTARIRRERGLDRASHGPAKSRAPLPLRRPRFESLESRVLLAFDPTGLEQEMLEQFNRFRTNPQGELNVLFSSINPLIARDPDSQYAIQYFNDPTSAEIQADWPALTPVQPLAWNESLYTSATNHNNLMLQYDAQQHVFPGELAIGPRQAAAGYTGTSYYVYENIYAYAKSAVHAHNGFVIDWANGPGYVSDPNNYYPHRRDMMVAACRDVGISVIADSSTTNSVGPLLVTEDFGYRTPVGNSMLVGVIYRDLNGDGRYEAGEGVGGASVRICGPNGTFTTTSMTAGGYQAALPPGTYNVTVTGGSITGYLSKSSVTIGTQNIKVDFEASKALGAEKLFAGFGGTNGLWSWQTAAGWQPIHNLTPVWAVPVDVDGNGRAELAVNFGPGVGTWLRTEAGQWQYLTSLNSTAAVAADFNGCSKEELIISVNDGAYSGLWIYYPSIGNFVFFHPWQAQSITAGDLDGNGKKELIFDFGSNGLWVYWNQSVWRQLHWYDPTSMTVGDYDGNGKDDLAVQFAGSNNIWMYRDTGVWQYVHTLSVGAAVAADVNGDGRDEFLFSFNNSPFAGVWKYTADATTWTCLTGWTAEAMVAYDVNGDGQKEVSIDFGKNGLWLWANGAGWQGLNGLNPAMLAGVTTAPQALTIDPNSRRVLAPTAITTEELTPIVAEAKRRLSLQGGTAWEAALAAVTVELADLPSGKLGSDVGSLVRIDRDADGFGWFVDSTPGDDSEFGVVKTLTERIATKDLAADRVDLLTAVMHEMGHAVGLDHSDRVDLMFETLSTGARRSLAPTESQRLAWIAAATLDADSAWRPRRR